MLWSLELWQNFLKISNEKDMEDAGSLVSVTLLLLMAKYGTTIGPSFPKLVSASPALILQEFGNIGTALFVQTVLDYLK